MRCRFCLWRGYPAFSSFELLEDFLKRKHFYSLLQLSDKRGIPENLLLHCWWSQGHRGGITLVPSGNCLQAPALSQVGWAGWGYPGAEGWPKQTRGLHLLSFIVLWIARLSMSACCLQALQCKVCFLKCEAVPLFSNSSTLVWNFQSVLCLPMEHCQRLFHLKISVSLSNSIQLWIQDCLCLFLFGKLISTVECLTDSKKNAAIFM